MKGEITQLCKGQFYWRILNKRGDEVAKSGRGFKTRAAAEKDLLRLIDVIARGDFQIKE